MGRKEVQTMAVLEENLFPFSTGCKQKRLSPTRRQPPVIHDSPTQRSLVIQTACPAARLAGTFKIR